MTRRNLFALVFYLALALGLTYPLVLQFGDHVPGSETWALDEYTFVWSQWWFKHALFDLDTNLLATRLVFYPLGLDLAAFTMLWAHAVIGLPVQLAFGVVPATNAAVLATFVLGAFGMYLLARHLMRNSGFADLSTHLAALVAGAAFVFTSSRMVYAALGHYNILATQWLPFYVLFLIKTVSKERGWGRDWLLAALFAAFTLYSDSGHAPLLVLFTLLYLAFKWRAVLRRETLARLALLGASVVVLFAPLLVPLVNEIYSSGYQLPGWGHAENLLVDLFGFFTPTSLHPLNRRWTEELDLVRQQISRFRDVNTFFVGYATAALALVGALVFRNQLRVWIAGALVFAVLALGPLLSINGKSVFDLDGLSVTFPMPFLLLHYIPFLKENRVPNRYSILVVLALAVLIGYAVAWIWSQVSSLKSQATSSLRFTFYVLLFTVLLFEHLALPLPLSDARVPEVYRRIAQEPGDFAILSLPLGWRNSFGTQGAEDTRTQYYQSVHGKYLLSGNASRNPPFLFEYFDRISLFHSISQIELYQPVDDEILARDKAQAGALMSFFDIRYVVLNAATPGRLPYSDTRGAVADYVEQVLPLGEKVYDRDGVIAYRVNQAPLPTQAQVLFGGARARIYQAEGWDRDETIAGAPANWANRSSARFLLPVRDIADYALTVRALPFTYPQSPAQTMEISVNGQAIAKFDLGADWQDYSATIPARALRAGINDVVFRFAYAVRPRDVLPANYAIGATEITSPVDIIVNSGALGSIKIAGREQSRLGRGYNVVVVDPKSGAVVSAKVFNTADERSQSRALTDFIAEIPDGMIVAVAAQEEIAANLGDRTVAGLQSLGGQIDVRTNGNRSHAIIGVKGARPGTALEQANEGTSFLSVGRSPDDRTLAAAVGAITFHKK
ncbi:MAG: hypothetical protein HY782_10860 [Chloroflexi bacterium]|nr:hypothetical protein [Chloroflexota bacterium]